MSWLQPEDFRLEAGHQMMGNLHTSLNPCRSKVSVLAATENVKMDDTPGLVKGVLLVVIALKVGARSLHRIQDKSQEKS